MVSRYIILYYVRMAACLHFFVHCTKFLVQIILIINRKKRKKKLKCNVRTAIYLSTEKTSKKISFCLSLSLVHSSFISNLWNKSSLLIFSFTKQVNFTGHKKNQRHPPQRQIKPLYVKLRDLYPNVTTYLFSHLIHLDILKFKFLKHRNEVFLKLWYNSALEKALLNVEISRKQKLWQ